VIGILSTDIHLVVYIIIMSVLPSNLPSISRAKLPATYAAAKAALADCTEIDECKSWADKAEALASYAKQADDPSLRKMADRIQARAIRRCGELLRAIAPKETTGRTKELGGHLPNSKSQAAKDAGMSRHQKRTALRVSNIPGEDFEAAVESDNPPTVTALAQRGKKPTPKPLIDLEGRDPKDFQIATHLQGEFRRFREYLDKVDFDAGIRGSFPYELAALKGDAKAVREKTDQLLRKLNEQNQNECVSGTRAETGAGKAVRQDRRASCGADSTCH
jgi:hypothetical protein